jgi:hypothetical protein
MQKSSYIKCKKHRKNNFELIYEIPAKFIKYVSWLQPANLKMEAHSAP